jgi:hypothetical protein
MQKYPHNWGTNTITIQGKSTMRTIPITKKLGVQTKRPKVLICYDFHHGISNEEEDVMFATKLDLFSIRTIVVPIHTKLVSIPNYKRSFRITYWVLKQQIEPICVLAINLIIPLYIVKQHCLRTLLN